MNRDYDCEGCICWSGHLGGYIYAELDKIGREDILTETNEEQNISPETRVSIVLQQCRLVPELEDDPKRTQCMSLIRIAVWVRGNPVPSCACIGAVLAVYVNNFFTLTILTPPPSLFRHTAHHGRRPRCLTDYPLSPRFRQLPDRLLPPSKVPYPRPDPDVGPQSRNWSFYLGCIRIQHE